MGASESANLDAKNTDDSYAAQKIIMQDNAKYGEFDQLFSKFDKNTDGFLDEPELISAIKHYMHVRPEFKMDLDDLLSDMETSNPIKKEDFREMMSLYTGGTETEENIIDVFKLFDKNLDGKVGTEEVCHVFGKIGLNLNYEQGQKLLLEADKDEDGCLDFDEFIKIIISK